jgi:hypothetical protein
VQDSFCRLPCPNFLCKLTDGQVVHGPERLDIHLVRATANGIKG